MRLDHQKIEITTANRGLSHTQLAKLMNVAVCTLSLTMRRIRNGGETQTRTAYRFARALHCNVVDLLANAE